MGENEKTQSSGKKHDRFFDGIVEIFLAVYKISKEAFKTKFYSKKENWILYSSGVLVFFLMFFKGHYGYFLDFLCLGILRPIMVKIVHSMSFWTFLLISFSAVGFTFLMAYGIRPYKRFRGIQKALDEIGLKSGLGHRPVLLDINDLDENRTKLLVKSSGLGEERYKPKLDDLRASLGQKVESVKFSNQDNTCVEMMLIKKDLPRMVHYRDLNDHLKKPYSFIVGQSINGVVTESLEDVPHYLFAGATGYGKSVSFKGMLLGLLESSKRIQMYLFDFKRVELVDFKGLPNVVLVNEIADSGYILQKIEKEMDRRYKYLEEKGFKSIVPERDNLDRIVIGIDECTDLTGQVKRSHPGYSSIEKGRVAIDSLARKGRAAGIHLAFATQKIDKYNLETRVQENVEGRFALRVGTIENSIRVLQNGMASNLPEVKGRAIWRKGATYTEVQSPFYTDEEMIESVNAMIVSGKFKEIKMLNLDIVAPVPKKSAKKAFTKESKEA